MAESRKSTPVMAGTSHHRSAGPAYPNGGPCPPIGRHRYFFKLYALDTVLPDLHQPDKDQLLATMQGHVLEEAILMGTYQH